MRSMSLAAFSWAWVGAALVLGATACSSDAAESPQPDQDAGVRNDADVQDASNGDASSESDSGLQADAGPQTDAAIDDASTAGSSQGSGGLDCSSEPSLGGDRSFCLASESGVEVKLAVPADFASNTSPLRLGLYLHGDGAGAHRSNSAMRTLLPWIDEHHAIMVSVLAPNGCAWWLSPEHDCASDTEDRDVDGANARALDAVLQTIRSRYDIANDAMFYYGSSGGSVFLTSNFFPRFGDRYPGAMALNCGGEAPTASSFTWDVANAGQRGSTRMWFTYGSNDFLRTEIEASIGAHRGFGFDVQEKRIEGAGHCEFDGHGRAREVWTEFLAP